VPLPEQDEYVAVLSPGGNMRYQSDKIRFFLESPAEPRRTYEYHVPTRTIALLSEKGVRMTVQGADCGVQPDGPGPLLCIPIWKKPMVTDLRWLMGYGAGQSVISLRSDDAAST
jgi:hypothetical protein